MPSCTTGTRPVPVIAPSGFVTVATAFIFFFASVLQTFCLEWATLGNPFAIYIFDAVRTISHQPQASHNHSQSFFAEKLGRGHHNYNGIYHYYIPL